MWQGLSEAHEVFIIDLLEILCSAAAALGPNVDPAVRLLLEEKEQAILALQETVEVRY